MTVAVTGATGHLGRLVLDDLLARGTAPDDVVAVVRDPSRATDLAERGLQVRLGDYDRPDTLGAALKGVDTLLLVSGNEVGRRVAQHRAVVEAAVAAGVARLAYTSITRADTTPLLLATEHRETERLVRASGLRYTLLRNSWYVENYTEQLGTTLEHKAILGSAGSGRVSAATRADYAAAAAAVLVGDGPSNHAYELGGDTAFTLAEYAGTLSELTGEQIAYVDQPPAEYQAFLESVGVPGAMAQVLADSDLGLARGDLLVESGDLSGLIGRPTTSLADAIRAALG
jgi:NAD(P)H dehydrogenase (quinone)